MPGITGHGAVDAAHHDPGHRQAVGSLLMLPANVVWMVVSYLVGTAGMALVGAQEGHLLTEYGAGGWAAWAFMLAFMAVPSVVGVVLGVRARRRGAGNLALTGIWLNALAGVGLVALSAAQVVI